MLAAHRGFPRGHITLDGCFSLNVANYGKIGRKLTHSRSVYIRHTVSIGNEYCMSC